jgi:hypothetical protein
LQNALALTESEGPSSDDQRLEVIPDNTQSATKTASSQLVLGGKAVVICNEESSWSINRATYDIQRTVLNDFGAASGIVADPENQERISWSDFKSFDRFRNKPTSQSDQSSPNPSHLEPLDGGVNAKNTLLLSVGALGVVYGILFRPCSPPFLSPMTTSSAASRACSGFST